jgi:N-acetylmuramoyl-L-alanine amidase
MFHYLKSSSFRPSRSILGKFVLRTAVALAVAFGISGCVTQNTYTLKHFSTVVVDAGHGGHDSGTMSRGGRRTVRILEKDVALDVARRVNSKLRDAGLRTVMTRSNDTFIPLDTRCDISNAQSDSVFVSIHFNDSRRRVVHGVEVYQNGRGTDGFAHAIAQSVASVPGECFRGVMHANYRVLRKSRGPAVLVECGYLSNSGEASRCASAAYREKIADRIAAAIIDQHRKYQ